MDNITLTPELTKLFMSSLGSPTFRDNLLAEAQAEVTAKKVALESAKQDLAKAEQTYRQVLELGGPLPRVIQTVFAQSDNGYGQYAIQVWLEADGTRRVECECPSFTFSRAPKHCKHIDRNRYRLNL